MHRGLIYLPEYSCKSCATPILEMKQRHTRAIAMIAKEVDSFRDHVMRDCGALIGGSKALFFLDPSVPTTGVSQIFVSAHHLRSVLEHLLTVEDYELLNVKRYRSRPLTDQHSCLVNALHFAAAVYRNHWTVLWFLSSVLGRHC
ncbi:hypothetical protein ACG7TL_006718 [Trametes sanguinea]